MLSYTDITGRVVDKVQTAIDRLRSFEPAEGYYLAFSGGKDSCCIKELAIMSGVKFDAHYNATTVDPPELVRFIKTNHPDVEIMKPKLNMKQLIIKNKYPPTRLIRYCCSELKEKSGFGRVTVTGVRWAESVNRKKKQGVVRIGMSNKDPNKMILNDDNDESRRLVEHCYRTTTTLVNPIVDWLDEDVWEFIRERNLPYCILYDEGFKRLGCVGCPMASKYEREKNFKRWPQYERYYRNAFTEMLEKQKETKRGSNFKNADDVFEWWMGRSKKAELDGQTGMEEVDDVGGKIFH